MAISQNIRYITDSNGNIISEHRLRGNEEFQIVKKKKELTPGAIKIINNKNEIKKYNSELGGFITMCYVKNELLFNHLNIELSNISRLIYLSTFITYNNKENGLLVIQESGKKDIPMTRQFMKKKLKLSERAFTNFLSNVKDENLLFYANDKFYINSEYFTKGKVVFKSKEYTRLYIDTIRIIYDNCTSRQHKQLSYIFQLIPKMNYQYNILCNNPDEQIEDSISKMTLVDICEFLNVSVSNRVKLKKSLLQFYTSLNGHKYYLFKYVTVEGSKDVDDYFVINPTVIWGGDDYDKIKDTLKFLYFGNE